MLVPGDYGAANLARSVSADDYEAVELRLAVRSLGCLFALGGCDYRATRRTAIKLKKRTQNPSDTRNVVRGNRSDDSRFAGSGPRQRNNRRPVSANTGESRLAPALCSAGLL